MAIDQLALLLTLVIAANIVLVAALGAPTLGRWSSRARDGADAIAGGSTTGAGRVFGREGGAALERTVDAHVGHSATTLPAALYQRVVRVVSFLFIGAVLVIATLTGNAGPPVYVMLAVGAFLIVLFQDLLLPGSLGRWRLPIEAGAAVAFLTVLLVLTGGHGSPYFFGYILLLGAASLWASGLGPTILALLTSAAYLVGVVVAAGGARLPTEELGRVGFNLVALALVTYVAAVIGREQRRAREEALRLSTVDSLTGLHSRDFLLSAVEQEVLRSARSERPFGLLMVDLDGLKAANDRFGHASGDRLLQAVSEVLRGDIRITDVAARYGGDEFVILLPDTDLAGALRVAEKLRVDIARLALPHDGAVIRTSASIGLVTYPDDGRTSAELMRRADLAMYEAKRRGRDQIVRYAREPLPVSAPPPPQQSPAAAARRPEPPPPEGVPPPTGGHPPWEAGAP